MKFRSTCMYKRQDNIKAVHSIIRSGLLNHQIYDLRFTLFSHVSICDHGNCADYPLYRLQGTCPASSTGPSMRWLFPLEPSSMFVKMVTIYEIINATDSLVQNIIRIFCLCWLTFHILNWRPWNYNELRAPIFIKIRLVFHASYLWNEAGDLQFLFHLFLKQVNQYLSAVEV